MPKLLWVVAPILVALAAWSIQALRGRRPSRHALNVWASVLLLGYVLATAGLGIFWVANQQLPVFDWHYLFGYGTLALVALHLTFNFRIVWRALTRRRVADDAAPAAPGTGRRHALGWGAAALASAAAFWLGTLRGRSVAESAPSSSSADAFGAWGASRASGEASDAALAAVERFHAVSSNSRAGLLVRAPSVDWGGSPALFKRYPGSARIALAATAPRSATLDAAALGHVLWHTSGITDKRSGLDLRASPSSGALFPAELYVFCRAVRGVADGWWHHDVQTHALETVSGAAATLADVPEMTAAAPERGPAAFVVATAVFRRTGHKYRDRTYRYVLADLGHALENLRVAAGSIGIAASFVPPFDQAATAAALGVDEREEGVLAVAALHAGRPVAAPVGGSAETGPWWSPLAA
ncbi:MAG: SagB/ThcOx family dehydrogenase, partial [Caldimonas sp.]